MASKMATEAAEAILSDRRGARFYKDPRILASFLEDKFGPLESSEAAIEVAEAILADFRGAAYYEDVAILADFIEGQLGPHQGSGFADDPIQSA